MDNPSLRRETRYGMPAADQILFNRFYVLGYSYYFRQAKWALEIINPPDEAIERKDVFRTDYRLPEMFRADLEDYKNSGLDRGHLVASENQKASALQNSETFLLSNMSPQKPQFNQEIWKTLESKVRELNNQKKILETYVISGPIFHFNKPVEFIGENTNNEIALPIPNCFFKSILTENNRGTLNMWSFIIPNEASDLPLEEFRVKTTKVEKYAGIELWSRLSGRGINSKKNNIKKMW